MLGDLQGQLALMVPDIPLEVIDIILNNLHRDPPTNPLSPLQRKSELCACRLVRRSWALLAAPHVFRDVYYSFSYSIEHTHQIADKTYPDVPGRWTHDHYGIKRPLKTLKDLHDFLIASPRVQYSIRWLCLYGYTFDDWAVSECLLPAELLVATLRMLPNLRDVHLVDVAAQSASIANHIGTYAGRVERPLAHLSLRYRAWPYSQNQMIQTLSAFEIVDKLALFPVRPSNSTAWPHDEAGTLHVRNLELTFGGNGQWREGPLLTYLRGLLVLDYIRSICIHGAEYTPPPERQAFVDAVMAAFEALAQARYKLWELQGEGDACIQFIVRT